MDELHSEEKGGLTLKIFQDEDARQPDEGDDNLLLVHYHRQFDVRRDPIVKMDDIRAWYRGIRIPAMKKYWIFEVAAYIHSGVVLSLDGSEFPDQCWDVSHVGAVLAAKSEWRLSKSAGKAAQGLIETWNRYLSGDVYGYSLLDSAGEHVDSCWGIYGLDEAKREGLQAMEEAINKRKNDEH